MKSKSFKKFLVSFFSCVGGVIGLLFFWGNIPPKNQPTTLFSDRGGLEGPFDKIFAKNDLSGAVLVSQKNQILLRKTYGWEDAKQKILNHPHTRFNIGSCTKQMTGFLILQLEREGKLNRAEPLERVIPELSNTQIGAVTIEQLLQMSGGVPSLMKPLTYLSAQLSSKQWTTAEILQKIKNYPLNSEPCTRYEYSNLSYVLLGIVAEKVTGQSWEQLLQDRIFIPFQMNETVVSKNQTIKNLAKPFLIAPRFGFWGPNVYFPMPQWNYSTLKGAGGIVSTIGDLHRWEKGLTEFAQTNQYFSGGGPGNYSYGWQTLEFQNSRIQFHAGETPGYCALIVRCSNSHSTAILLFNSDFIFLNSNQCSLENLQNQVISILDSLGDL